MKDNILLNVKKAKLKELIFVDIYKLRKNDAQKKEFHV